MLIILLLDMWHPFVFDIKHKKEVMLKMFFFVVAIENND